MQLIRSTRIGGNLFLATSIKDGWRVYDLKWRYLGLAPKEAFVLVGNNYRVRRHAN